VNTPVSTHVKNFTKSVVLKSTLMATVVAMGTSLARAEWSVDFSRRSKAVRDSDLLDGGRTSPVWKQDREPASVPEVDTAPSRVMEDIVPDRDLSKSKGVFDTLFDAGEPVQDIVIMQTEKGFVPSSVRVRKNGRYKIHVVNVNEKEKNVSFILDGFSEHHATYYGKIKTFTLEPKKEGAYSFQSPETSAEGRLIVFNPEISLRAPATAEASPVLPPGVVALPTSPAVERGQR
jgi:Cupredoxin-like domain